MPLVLIVIGGANPLKNRLDDDVDSIIEDGEKENERPKDNDDAWHYYWVRHNCIHSHAKLQRLRYGAA